MHFELFDDGVVDHDAPAALGKCDVDHRSTKPQKAVIPTRLCARPFFLPSACRRRIETSLWQPTVQRALTAAPMTAMMIASLSYWSAECSYLLKTFIKHFLIQNQIRISMSALKRLPLRFFLHFDKRGHRRQLNLPSRSDV